MSKIKDAEKIESQINALKQYVKGSNNENMPVTIRKADFETMADAWRVNSNTIDDYKLVSERLKCEIKVI